MVKDIEFRLNKIADNMEEIRALSWKQPYADLMLHGKIETRTWNTNYRGLVLICSSMKPYSLSEMEEISTLEQRIEMGKISGYSPNFLQTLGIAIAIGRLVDSRPMKVEDEEKCFVKYNPDLFCHVYEDVKPIEPFDWKGSQGWRILTEAQKNLIKIKP